MRLNFQSRRIPSGALGGDRITGAEAGVLWLVVPYTTPELTRAALRHASACTELDAHVALIDVQVVPFPLKLTEPPINRKFSKDRLTDLLGETALPGDVDVLYARDWHEGIRSALPPLSVVVLATKKGWFSRTREEKLARFLAAGGHQAILLRV